MFSVQLDKFHQSNLLGWDLRNFLNKNDFYYKLANKIDWQSLVDGVAPYYGDPNIGRSAIPLRQMVGLTIVKFVENLSDARTVTLYSHDPYVQYFCGNDVFTPQVPCDASSLSNFRTRIGQAGCQLIFQASTMIHGDKAMEPAVIIDTTAQVKNVTFPTDIKLLNKILIKCWKYAKKYGIVLRNKYARLVKELLRTLRFGHGKKHSLDVRKARKSFWTIVGRVLRDLVRKMTADQLKECEDELKLFEKVINQTCPVKDPHKNITKVYNIFIEYIEFLKEIFEAFGLQLGLRMQQDIQSAMDNFQNAKGKGKQKKLNDANKSLRSIIRAMIKKIKKSLERTQLSEIAIDLADIIQTIKNPIKDDRIYSLHEPGVACITKGKAGVKHEYGSKASVAVTKDSGIIVGAKNFQGNPHDGNTVKETIENVEETTGQKPEVAYVDRGYQGAQEKNPDIVISMPSSPTSDMSEDDKKEARKNFGRRSSVEPLIGHLKSDFRLARTYLKGAVGDAINLLMSCAAYNFKKWFNLMKAELNSA